MTGYCHPCKRERPFRFAGYATDGAEQTASKPRSQHHSCRVCGHTVLTLGNVHDAEGLCVTTVRRRIHAETRGVEIDDAVAYLYWHVWRLYLGWQPERLSFLSYAAHWLPRRLDAFISEATGDVTQRRATPKAHAVSDSYDVLADRAAEADTDDSFDVTDLGAFRGRGNGGLDETLGRDDPHADDDRPGDLRWILRGGNRDGARRAAL